MGFQQQEQREITTDFRIMSQWRKGLTKVVLLSNRPNALMMLNIIAKELIHP